MVIVAKWREGARRDIQGGGQKVRAVFLGRGPEKEPNLPWSSLVSA